MKLLIDSREQSRIAYAQRRCKGWGWESEVKELPIGDYVCGNTVVEYKTVMDYCHSMYDGRLKRETINQANTFPFHFVIVEGNVHMGCKSYAMYLQRAKKIDYKPSFFDTHFYSSVASLSTYTNVLMVDNQKSAFNLMKLLFEKCNDDKGRVVLPIDKMSRNPCYNYIRSIPRINDKRANAIVDALELTNLKELLDVKKKDLLTVKGIGDTLADEIMKAIRGS